MICVLKKRSIPDKLFITGLEFPIQLSPICVEGFLIPNRHQNAAKTSLRNTPEIATADALPFGVTSKSYYNLQLFRSMGF